MRIPWQITWQIPWEISAGEMFELMRPAAFAVSALLSTVVLADSRKSGSDHYRAFAWALGTLFFPFIIFPVYLISRFQKRSRRGTANRQPSGGSQARPASSGKSGNGKLRVAVPLVYAAVVYSSGALLFYLDYTSFDAHLARANQARLLGHRGVVIREYRRALLLKDDPHTHNLLATELAADGRWTDALSEYRIAQDGAEPDDDLPLNIAGVLERLNRTDEARGIYVDVLKGPSCRESRLDPKCELARSRLNSMKAMR